MEVDLIREAVAKLGTQLSPGSSVFKGYTYNPIPFPGYEDIPCHRREESEKRWQLIDNIVENWKDKLVLDYGCATGYFTFQAAKKGAKVLAIEQDIQAANVCFAILDKFYDEYGLEVLFKKYYDDSCKGSDWHIVFALNILNWIGQKKAEQFLKSLGNVGVMFLEMPLKNDGMRGADWLITDEDVVSWVKQHSPFTKVNAIGSSMGPSSKQRTLFLCHSLKVTQVKSI